MLNTGIKLLTGIFSLCLASCAAPGLSRHEINIINHTDMEQPVMRVLKVDNDDDLGILQLKSERISQEMFENGNADLRLLFEKMLATVNDPANDGVGIAAPQVGISRRIIAVQRLDKESEPFEIYINPEITETAGEKSNGPEGCLSVPDRSGIVARWRDITIRYNSPADFSVTQERITGFTAVIFQHEIDHLDGIIYTDKLETDDLPDDIIE